MLIDKQQRHLLAVDWYLLSAPECRVGRVMLWSDGPVSTHTCRQVYKYWSSLLFETSKLQSQDSLFSIVLHASCNAHTDRRAQQLVWWTTVAKADLNLTLQHQQHQPACRHLTSVCSQTPVGCKVVVHHTQLLQMNPRDALLCVHHAVHRCERSVW